MHAPSARFETLLFDWAMRKGKHLMNNLAVRKTRRRWRRRTYVWTLISVAVVSALLYWEQVALLYFISSVWTCGLLLRVAFSDLESRDKELSEPEIDTRTATTKRHDTAA